MDEVMGRRLRKPRFDTWLWMGRTESFEFVITWRLPWRRRMYCINSDEMMIAHPRVSFRLRWGKSVDQYAPRRLVQCGPPATFSQPQIQADGNSTPAR